MQAMITKNIAGTAVDMTQCPKRRHLTKNISRHPRGPGALYSTVHRLSADTLHRSADSRCPRRTAAVRGGQPLGRPLPPQYTSAADCQTALMMRHVMTSDPRRRRYSVPSASGDRHRPPPPHPVSRCSASIPPLYPGAGGILLEAESAVDGAAVALFAADPFAHQALLALDAELVNKRPLGHLEKLQLTAERQTDGGR